MGLNSDRAWEAYGKQNPYYGVLTDPRYLADRLTDDARVEFFTTGTDHVANVLDLITRTVSPNFTADAVLDFGCGVGRLTIPFAMQSKSAVGVDISDSMLREARNNAARIKVANVQFLESDDELTRVSGLFSLVHSYIVLQHIPVRRGMRLIERLVDRIEPGGVGALHVTYASQMSRRSRWIRGARLLFPPLHWAVNAARGRPLRTPMMQMNSYDLGEVVKMIQARAQADAVHMELTQHSGFLGALLLFRRRGTPEGD